MRLMASPWTYGRMLLTSGLAASKRRRDGAVPSTGDGGRRQCGSSCTFGKTTTQVGCPTTISLVNKPNGSPVRTRSLRGGAETLVPKFTRAGSNERCAQASNFRPRSLAGALQQRQALPQNVVHVAASGPDELSFDSSAHGGFATVAWRDCLLGDARDLDGSGAITVDEVTRLARGLPVA